MGLEAQLDRQDKLELVNSSKRDSSYKNSSFNQPNSSPAHTLEENSLSLNTLLLPTPQELLFCDYLGNPCQNRVCFNNKYCGKKHFWDKWGLDYLK